MRSSALPRIALLALIWGPAFLWIKLADRGFSPVEVTLSRLATGAVVLFAVMLVRRDKVPRSVRLWITILAVAVRHQGSVTRRQGAGLVLGFAGAVLIFSPWHAASDLFSAGGLECLAASVSYAVSYIYMDRFLARRGIGAIVLSACQLAAAAVMLAVALGVSGLRTPRVTTQDIAAMAILGIIGTGVAYVLNYQIITSDGATAASMVTYLLPVVAIVLGLVVLNEGITATTLGGIALVLAGVALTRRPPPGHSAVSP